MVELELPEEVAALVTALAHRLGVPRAEVVRLAVTTLVEGDAVPKSGVSETSGGDGPP